MYNPGRRERQEERQDRQLRGCPNWSNAYLLGQVEPEGKKSWAPGHEL